MQGCCLSGRRTCRPYLDVNTDPHSCPATSFTFTTAPSGRTQTARTWPAWVRFAPKRVHLTGEILRDMGGRFWWLPEWRLTVTDETGAEVLGLRVSANQPG